MHIRQCNLLVSGGRGQCCLSQPRSPTWVATFTRCRSPLNHSVSASSPTRECDGLIYGKPRKSFYPHQTCHQLLPLQSVHRLPFPGSLQSPSLVTQVACPGLAFPTFHTCVCWHAGILNKNLALTRPRPRMPAAVGYFPPSSVNTCLDERKPTQLLQLGDKKCEVLKKKECFNFHTQLLRKKKNLILKTNICQHDMEIILYQKSVKAFEFPG